MAQVVQSKGWIGPLITVVIGIILMLNGVPALIQWLPWVAQTAIVMGTEYALEAALVPLLVAGAASFIGFLMLRGGFGALRERARGAAKRAQAQMRGGVQQVRREAEERYGQVTSQAEHLVNKVPQTWRERIEAAAAAVEQERAGRVQAGQPQPYLGQGQQQGQGQRLQQGYGQQAPQQQARPQQQQQPQQPRPRQAQQAQQQRRQPQRQQAPGADRFARIDELRQRVEARAQQAVQGKDAHQAAEQVRRAAQAAAARVQQGMPLHLDDATEALVGRLDLADAERIRRGGSTLVRSSLRSSSLSRTSLQLNSLVRSRR